MPMPNSPVPLTRRQQEVLDFIVATIDTTGHPPTVPEISEHLALCSPRAAECHLDALEHKGLIHRQHGRSRGIALLPPALSEAPAGREIPLLGRIAAGTPLLAVENIVGTIVVDPGLRRGGELFALEVSGDSMSGDLIASGDRVVIRRQETVEPSEIAAVLVDGEATLKRVCPFLDEVILKASNPSVPDIVVRPPAQAAILGKVVALIRRY
jgi:repressor LexA